MIALALSAILASSQSFGHEFVYTNSAASKVNLAGSFNGWNKETDPMARDADGKTWRITKQLGIGEHQYKFVIDGETWVTDPNAKSVDDGNGHTNSLLLLVPDDFSKPAKYNDSIITKSVLGHDAGKGGLVYDPATKRARFLFTTRKGDVASVRLLIEGKSVAMYRVGGDSMTDLFSASSVVKTPQAVTYSFLAVDGRESRAFKPVTPVDARQYSDVPVPKWAQRSVFYQIFPDRFANGNPGNDPAGTIPWGGKPEYFNFMGGDFAGVRQHMDYLSQLGISGIYFNPVFKGPSNHGYETTDYKLIEPRLGTNEEFSSLTRDLRKRGIATVLDGVFNHTSVDFFAFKEIRDLGAKAKTLDWYTIRSFPVEVKENPNYEAWFGFPSMPKLHVMNPDTTKYLLSVLDYWNDNADIAGWRLDVANEVPQPFWRLFRSHLKEIRSDAWVIGENWGDSSQWLKGDQWDSAMNYPMREAILQHIALGSNKPSQFLDQIMRVYLLYGPNVSNNMLNSLSTHDTPRFRFLAKESDALARMGAVALFSVPGVPCIYYGDEIGMTGGPDPDNRRGMDWGKAVPSNPTFLLYQKLAAARTACPALQYGEPIPLFADDPKQVSAFARVAGADVAIACFNRSDKIQTVEFVVKPGGQAPSKPLVDVVSGKALNVSRNGRLRISLPAQTAILAVPQGQTAPKGRPQTQNTW
ncbi:MAG: hypothetical protein JNM28_07515 [Armatimonadetes bacterium]|nr:hypothetical protein [Armatimonadota bacterium]